MENSTFRCSSHHELLLLILSLVNAKFKIQNRRYQIRSARKIMSRTRTTTIKTPPINTLLFFRDAPMCQSICVAQGCAAISGYSIIQPRIISCTPPHTEPFFSPFTRAYLFTKASTVLQTFCRPRTEFKLQRQAGATLCCIAHRRHISP